MTDLARRLAETGRLRIGIVALPESSASLATPPPGTRPVKAGALCVDPDGPAGDAFVAVARNCLQHFRANEAGLGNGHHPERLHQARVALRRLRSAFTVFAPVLGPDEPAPIRAELRALSRLLGEARDLDVYRDGAFATGGAGRSEGRPDGGRPDGPGLVELAARIERDRARAYGRIEERLSSAAFRRATADLLAFLDDGAWRSDPRLAAERDRPLRAFAATMLERRWRRLRKRGRKLRRLDPEARHRVRISAKTLRYAAEFCRSVAGDGRSGRRHARLIGTLERLQSSLGELNDIALMGERERQPALPHGPEAAGHLPSTAEPGGGPHVARSDVLLKTAAKAHRALRRAKPFWR